MLSGGERKPEAVRGGRELVVGLLRIELHIPNTGSLKDKRQVLKSLKDRLRSRYNISISEVDHSDLWQRSVLAIAHVSNDKRYANKLLSGVLSRIDQFGPVHLIDHDMEFL